MVKCLLTILLACIIIKISSAQQRNVNDFTSATWNTDGAKWNEVQTLMTNYGLKLLAVQEAGSITNINPPLLLTDHSLPLSLAGILVNYESMGVQECTWDIIMGQNTSRYYVYYYNNFLNVQLDPGTSRGATKQNMAIISKQRADEIIIIPPQTRHNPINALQEAKQERTFINRPALGIRIGNGIFFNIHAEPRRNNEAPILIEEIQNYTRDFQPGRTWMAMGDFNTTPNDLRPLLRPNTLRFVEIKHSDQFTRFKQGYNPSELDYSVVGGPSPLRGPVTAIRAQVLQIQSRSDHKPVKFN